MDQSNDPAYLQKLVQGLQQQRNTAQDTIAHLAALNAQKDEQIANLRDAILKQSALVEQLKAEKENPPEGGAA